MTAPQIRLTIGRSYRSGAETLALDTGALDSLAAARAEILKHIDTAFELYGAEILGGGAEMVFRVAAGSFQPIERRAAPRPRRVAPQDEF